MVMRFGEWRVSSYIEFLMSDWGAYRELRQLITTGGVEALGKVTALREVRADRYGIRALLDSSAGPIKLEIIHEGRIDLDTPGPDDQMCGIATLKGLDMVATKLLANDDRWADRGLFSRDLIDLALLPVDDHQWNAGMAKAIDAYGASISRTLQSAVAGATEQPQWFEGCIHHMQMDSISADQLREKVLALSSR